MTIMPPAVPVLESAVEQYLCRRVARIGGQCLKLVPVDAGVPDRLVILPWAGMYLVELKSPTGKPSPIQQVWHTRSAAIGEPVAVLHSPAEVDEWLRENMDAVHFQTSKTAKAERAAARAAEMGRELAGATASA